MLIFRHSVDACFQRSHPTALLRSCCCSSTHTPRRKAKKAASAVAEQGGAHIGDVVTVRLRSDNEAISLGLTCDEPLQFELGSEGFLGNELYQAIDQATQGLVVGQVTALELQSPEWNPELLFEVPAGHPEVERLEGRYKAQGGVQIGAVVELANGASAVVVSKTDNAVMLDANSPFASQPTTLNIELLDIDRQQPIGSAEAL